jgi:UDP-glucose 4-epimerase
MTEKFNEWNELKKTINEKELINFKQGEIYFMSIGQNIGHEVYGKDELFLRPVLVYRKLSKQTFVGIPLSSKEKIGSYFFNFQYTKKTQSTALLNQIRVFDIKRVDYYSGRIKRADFSKLEDKLKKLLNITPKQKAKEIGTASQEEKWLKCSNIVPNLNTNVKSKILITGAAGYIGSHVAKQLLEQGKNIVVVDNLSTGFIKTIDTLQTIKKFDFINLDLKEFEKVEEIFKVYKIDTVIHFAAFSQVGESMSDPMKYYMNNTVNTTHLVKCASSYGVKKFIFSSTAATYGEPAFKDGKHLIDEDFETKPINPYGQSKLMSEQVIKDEAKVNNKFKYCIFRYFNVAGADIHYEKEKLSPRVGESHEPETHLIPLVVKTALKKRDSITIFGEDYDTLDGTCVRDYIHVDDLADAHIKAIDYLDENESDTFNCGYGHGYSVKQIVQGIKETTKCDFKVLKGSRRAGDPSILVSDNNKIKEKMNWKPKYDDLELIIRSAFEWEKKL